jgi:DNA-binding GntR family transcriptional regulator
MRTSLDTDDRAGASLNRFGGLWNDQAALPGAPRAAGLADILRGRILNGYYTGGDRLREVALQQEFGLSNGPIREALQALAADGLVVREPRRGVCVIALSDDELRHLFEMRVGLLELAAELAARRRDPRFAAGIASILSAIQDAAVQGDLEANLPLGFAFTCFICESSGNPELLATWKRLMLRLRLAVYRSLVNTDPVDVARICQRLADSITAGEVEAARTAARSLGKRHLSDLSLSTLL